MLVTSNCHNVLEELWVLFFDTVKCFIKKLQTSKWTGNKWNNLASLPLSPNEVLGLNTRLNGDF